MATNKEYKQIRVFLSSTFQDMQQERNALVKLFRQLAEEGRKQRISITLLDLRWGITDDQKRNGMVISTCLQEIDNSRPFFIGLIGERYGWVPGAGEFQSVLMGKFPVLKEYADRKMSITEIEMRYGVLNNDNNVQSIFFLKSGVKPESTNHAALIRDIDQSPNTKLFTYDSIESLVERVREEFLQTLSNQEKEEDANPQGKISALQERIRYTKSEEYLEVGDYKSRLNAWSESDENTLAIVGDVGVGKTTLVSSWLYEAEEKFTHVIYYFIKEEGNLSTSKDIQAYLIHRLEAIYGLNIPLDDDPDSSLDDDYVFELEDALKEVEKNGDTLLIVIDGLNYLEPTVLNNLLFWLPEIPKGVKMLLTTTKVHVTHHALTERLNCKEVEMQPFTPKETSAVIEKVLSRFGKKLPDDLVDRLAENELFQNGAMLRILLDDLLAYGVHEEIPNQVAKYSTAADVTGFFNLIVARAEEFYGREVVRQLMVSLMISRYGLEEEDIREVLGLTPIEWSEIYCGLKNYLTFGDGKYTLRFPELTDVVLERYGDIEDEEVERLEAQILKCLSAREGEEAGIASLAYDREDMELLHDTLAPFDSMMSLLKSDTAQLFEYWKALQKAGYSMYEYIESMPKDIDKVGEQIPVLVENIAIMLNDFRLAESFMEAYIQLLSDSEEYKSEIISSYLFMGRLMNKHGEIEDSRAYASRARKMLEEHPDNLYEDWSAFYMLEGSNLYLEEDYEGALECHLLALDYSQKGDYDELTAWGIYNSIGLDLLALERYEEAIEALEKALQLATQLMTSVSFESSQIINNIGLAYLQMGEPEKALEYFKRAVFQIRVGIGETNMELFVYLDNLALCYIACGDYEAASDTLEEIKQLLEANEISEDEGYWNLLDDRYSALEESKTN